MRQVQKWWVCDGCMEGESVPCSTWEDADALALGDGWTEPQQDRHLCPTCSIPTLTDPVKWDSIRDMQAYLRKVNDRLCEEWGVVPGESYVYYAQRGRYIKIGFSRSVGTRMLRLQTGIQAVEPGGRRLEQQRHTQFRHCQVGSSEWFLASDPRLLDHIEGLRSSQLKGVPA